MNFDFQKFSIGVIDFFSIILPGALLTYMIKNDIGPLMLGDDQYNSLKGISANIIFLFSSYLSGHFVFLLGSWLLDNLYEQIRNATHWNQIHKLASGVGVLSNSFFRFLANCFIKDGADESQKQVIILKNTYFKPNLASKSVNAFQWSKARLAINHKEMLASVQRFEADSKFFRSFVIVLLLLTFWGIIVHCRWGLVLTNIPLIILALWRYIDQRLKSTSQAYWYVLTLESINDSKASNALEQQTSSSSNPTHAGGAVFKKVNKQIHYLLVKAKNSPKEWVLPKGHIETNETIQETAVREVWEETGVWAKIDEQDCLKTVEYKIEKTPIRVKYFLMQVVKEESSPEKREIGWYPRDEAIKLLDIEDHKEILRLAEDKLKMKGHQNA